MTAIAVVTGAGSGIGRAAAGALADAGFTVVAVGRRRGPLEETAGQAGRGAVAIVGDVTDPASVDRAVRRGRRPLRPPRPVVQQRRRRRPRCAARGAHRRAVAHRRRHDAHRGVPVHPARLPPHEAAIAARRRIINNGSISASVPVPTRRPTPPPNTRSPASPNRRHSTAGPTTSPAARSTSVTPPPR